MENATMQAAATNGAAIVNRQDDIATCLMSAVAIVDCVRVLSALERVPLLLNETSTGEGYADGCMTRDGSMPLALAHAVALIDKANKITNEVCRIALGKPATEQQ